MRAVVDKLGQPQVTVTRIDQQYMRALLVILAHHVVGEKRLSRPTRPKYELVAVGGDTFLHGQIRYIDVQRATAYPVHHFDAERRKRTLVVRFLHVLGAGSLPVRGRNELQEFAFAVRYQDGGQGKRCLLYTSRYTTPYLPCVAGEVPAATSSGRTAPYPL